MSFFAPRLERIKLSASYAVTQKVRDLQKEGRDIIRLTMGEPDFHTPDNVKRAVLDAMTRNQTRYTTVDGTDELKEAVRKKFERENELKYGRDQITVANGAKQIIFNAMMATVTRGDEVLMLAPYWVSYVDQALLAHGTPKIIVCRDENNHKVTPEQLDAAITPSTKWLVFNSPCNPTGAAYTSGELKALGEVLVRHRHVWIMTDDIYEYFLFDKRRFATLAQVQPELYERTLTVNGPSKTYAMTGFRIGYAGGARDLIRSMAKVQSQSTSNPCSVSQAATIEALTGPQDYVADRALEYQRRRDVVVPLLNSTPGLRCHNPEGAIYTFPNCAGVLGKRTPKGDVLNTEQDFALYVLDNGVAGVPGEAYGQSPYMRISLSAPMDTLKEACRRIRRACEELH